MTEKAITPQHAGDGHPEWDAEDVAISAAMHRISVSPAALSRVRAQLRAAAAADARVDHEEPAVIETVHRPVATSNAPSPIDRFTARRRVTVAALALATAMAFLLLYVRSRPLTENQLANYCVEQLEIVSAQIPQWQGITDDAAIKLEPLLRNLNPRLTLVGSKNHAAGTVANACTLWKFDTGNGKYLYVFDFEAARSVRDIPQRFRVIQQSSSSWSLAALQIGERLLVVAIEGDVTEYIKSLEYA